MPTIDQRRSAARATGAARDGKRILVLTPDAPAPPTWGFGVRVYHLATQLSRHHQVTLMAYRSPRDRHDWSEVARVLHAVHPVPQPLAFRARRLRQLRSLASPSSFHLTGLRSVAMQRAIDGLLRRASFDVVQVESAALMCFDFHSVPVVLDEHNIEYDLLRQVAQLERSPLRRSYGAIDARKARADEEQAWRRAQGCVATSLDDEAVIREASPSVPTAVVPNAVDTDAFRSIGGPVDPDRMLFVGKMNYRPNADAVAWFARHVLPRVHRSRPSAILEVIGHEVPLPLRSLPGVVWTGWVDDLRPHLDRAAIVVAPLRAGSGTRLKVLEGLAMSKPVVSTTVGAAGIDAIDGEHLLIGDGPDQMADQILRAMGDSRLAARLGAAGRDLVVRRYGWVAAVADLEAFHARVLTGTPRP